MEDGNGNKWLSDDVGGVFQLDGSYRYIKLVAWGGGTFTEPEIDAVMAVPEPLTMLGVFAGIAGVAGYIRKRRTA